MALLEVDFVVRAVLHPNLEDALDVHLHHVLLQQSVLCFEQFGEDGIVERLAAEQPDVEQEGLAHLASLAIPHHGRGRRLATHADQCQPTEAAFPGFRQRQWIGAVGVAAAGSGEYLFAIGDNDRLGLPCIVGLDAADERCLDVVVVQEPVEHCGHEPTVLTLGVLFIVRGSCEE